MSTSLPLFAADPLWRNVFWASYGAWFLSEWWIFSRDRRAAKGQNQDRGSFGVFFLAVPAGLFGAFGAAYGSPDTRIDAPGEALFWTAIALIWLGMALRLWSVITLGRFFRTSVFIQDDHRLITTGPYRKLRNPSYTGGLITFIGIGLAMGNWLSLASAAGGLMIAYAWRIRTEEKALLQRFGQAYADYMRKSWALIPPIW
jgi:protein-S-isoprenylcysteine O-methyltransferase